MRRLLGMSCLILPLGALAQDTPRHEAIHGPERSFTADEFRQSLLALRGAGALAEALSRANVTPQQAASLREFAESILKSQQDNGQKPELKLPKGILENPKIQELLQNEKLLQTVLENKQIQDLAKRIAERYKLPEFPDGATSRPNIDIPPALRPRQPTTPPRGSRPRQQPERSRDSGELAADNETRIEDRDARNPEDVPPSLRPATPTEQTQSPGLANQADAAPAAGRGFLPIPNLQVSPEQLLSLTERLQSVGALQGSETLDRIAVKLGGDGSPYDPSTGDGDRGETWLNRSVMDPWLQSPWVRSVEGISLDDISLPADLQNWLPQMNRWSLPNAPFAAPSLPSVDIPPLPRLEMPSLKTSAWSLGTTLGIVLAIGVLAMVMRLAMKTIQARFTAREQWSVARPALPLDPTRRESIRDWFEYLAYRALGSRAQTSHHKSVALELGGQSPAHISAAGRMAELYEEARYAPPEEALNPTLSENARTDVELLSQKPEPTRARA